jgi:hypothetical protein
MRTLTMILWYHYATIIKYHKGGVRMKTHLFSALYSLQHLILKKYVFLKFLLLCTFSWPSPSGMGPNVSNGMLMKFDI